MIENIDQLEYTIRNNPKSLPLYWWKLFKRIFNKHFYELSTHEQDLIINDNEHRFTVEFKNFIIGQVSKMFLDETLDTNQKWNWAISKRIY